ncbi:MAG: hypothetical protein E7253_03560 [Lachnospiraceae bacterium]|nr:hypothetical protein [Lachnospiraceae bacterium]
MKREIMMFIKSVTEEYNNEPKKNWVISQPYFDEELNLAGFSCKLELEKGGIQIGDRVCLHNDSSPGSDKCIIGTVLEETPFHYLIKVKITGQDKYYKRCVNKSTLFSSYTLERKAAEKQLKEKYERELKAIKLKIPEDILKEIAEQNAIISETSYEMLEKLREKGE